MNGPFSDEEPSSEEEDLTVMPNANDFKIVYAIITKKKKLSIPFFSKVVLKNNKKILEVFGYKICLCKIQNVKKSDITA